MTVAELIKVLSHIQNQDLQIGVASLGDSGEVHEITSVSISEGKLVVLDSHNEVDPIGEVTNYRELQVL